MPLRDPKPSARTVVEKALGMGASAAGVATLAALRGAVRKRHPSPVVWPETARTVVVLGLEHPDGAPEMDWWDNRPGGTPGNRRLEAIAKQLAEWIRRTIGIPAQRVPYAVDAGGVLLKDAAAVAGMGVIGRNNLLVTPAFGPRIRLRALLLDHDLAPLDPPDPFDPCRSCDAPCRRACPQDAFRSGAYDRIACSRQMAADASNLYRIMDLSSMTYSITCIRYCRACELACPVGRPRAAGKGGGSALQAVPKRWGRPFFRGVACCGRPDRPWTDGGGAAGPDPTVA